MGGCPGRPAHTDPLRNKVDTTDLHITRGWEFSNSNVTHPLGERSRITIVQYRRSRSIAVIGSGIAGLTAAYLLSAHDHVTLFEAEDQLGGHLRGHRVDDGEGGTVSPDSAFLIHDDTHPTMCRLFTELGIATVDTELSLSVRDDRIGLQYARSRGPGGLFPSWSNLARPRYLRMLAEVNRFHRAASTLLATGDAEDTGTLGAFLAVHKFSRYFADHFVTPLVATVWSGGPRTTMEIPARYLFAFLQQHGMLSGSESATTRTVVGGSVGYVDAIAEHIDEVRTGTPAGAVRRIPDGIELRAGGALREFDAVVIATRSDQALQALQEPTDAERATLGAMRYSTEHAYVHTDTSVLPTQKRAWALRNYLVPDTGRGVSITHDLSRLLGLTGTHRYLLTVGTSARVDPAAVIAETTYHRPLYTPDSVTAQRLLPSLNDDRVVFAGAYHGWGFREDGAASGVRAAEQLGARWPAERESEAMPC